MFVWIVQWVFGKLGPKDRKRLANGLGLWAPEMQVHWDRLKLERDFHSLINIGTEWTRLDPQRAFKVGVDSTVVAVVIAVLL